MTEKEKKAERAEKDFEKKIRVFELKQEVLKTLINMKKSELFYLTNVREPLREIVDALIKFHDDDKHLFCENKKCKKMLTAEEYLVGLGLCAKCQEKDLTEKMKGTTDEYELKKLKFSLDNLYCLKCGAINDSRRCNQFGADVNRSAEKRIFVAIRFCAKCRREYRALRGNRRLINALSRRTQQYS